MEIIDRNNGFLTTMAIGDAYGMRCEFVEHACALTPDDLNYAPHPTYVEYKAGDYTDDTQMSLANAEWLLKNGALTPGAFVEGWLHAYKRDPRAGYSRHMQKLMTDCTTPAEFMAGLDANKGVTGGSAMRSGVFGLLADSRQVMKLVLCQARITHNTDAGITAALAIAYAVHYLHHGGARENVRRFVEQCLSSGWNSPLNGYTRDPNNALNIVTQVFDVVSDPAPMTQTLLNAANYAPVTDTDTLCALTMLLASRDTETENDLPRALYEMAGVSPYGLPYLAATDRRLLEAYPRCGLYK